MSQPSKYSIGAAVERQHPLYRDPKTLRSEQVCPHCKRKTVEYHFMTDGHLIIAHHCPEHRDVIPLRSVIVRDHYAGVTS
ncbi:MAG: hypothetical protein H6R23_1459 [Proteobacteria bacterium]|nr:hypothetical protein [Pseudomonadota bacterium]